MPSFVGSFWPIAGWAVLIQLAERAEASFVERRRIDGPGLGDLRILIQVARSLGAVKSKRAESIGVVNHRDWILQNGSGELVVG
jgi:hypothetical protein